MPENCILNHKIRCWAIVSFTVGVHFTESADKSSFLRELDFRSQICRDWVIVGKKRPEYEVLVAGYRLKVH